MPQPSIELVKYLETPLPPLREQYPPGTGGTGAKGDFSDGRLSGIQVIGDFEKQVNSYLDTLPKDPIKPHPHYKYPKFVQAITTIPNPIKSPSDLQKCLSTLPLVAVSTTLTALLTDPSEYVGLGRGVPALDRAGYESDGGEEPSPVEKKSETKTPPWVFRFNKSPLGSGEFHLVQQGSDDVKLVVRTINSSAFSSEDWTEYSVTGPYRYNTKSRASWYWSRAWGATNRLQCKYYVLTDWQKWVFGKFDDSRSHGWVSPLIKYDAEDPSILQSLFYWCHSAIGDKNGFKPQKKDVSSLPALFPDNPARRVSVSHSGATRGAAENKVKHANESDIEESDVEE